MSFFDIKHHRKADTDAPNTSRSKPMAADEHYNKENTMSENDTEQLLQAQVRDKGENLSHGLVRRLAFGLRNQASSSSAKPVPVQGVRHNSQFQASTQQRPMIETASKVVKKRKASDSDMEALCVPFKRQRMEEEPKRQEDTNQVDSYLVYSQAEGPSKTRLPLNESDEDEFTPLDDGTTDSTSDTESVVDDPVKGSACSLAPPSKHALHASWDEAYAPLTIEGLHLLAQTDGGREPINSSDLFTSDCTDEANTTIGKDTTPGTFGKWFWDFPPVPFLGCLADLKLNIEDVLESPAQDDAQPLPAVATPVEPMPPVVFIPCQLTVQPTPVPPVSHIPSGSGISVASTAPYQFPDALATQIWNLASSGNYRRAYRLFPDSQRHTHLADRSQVVAFTRAHREKIKTKSLNAKQLWICQATVKWNATNGGVPMYTETPCLQASASLDNHHCHIDVKHLGKILLNYP